MPRGQSRTQGQPSAADIQRALRGIEYPCSKRDLMESAEFNGARDDVLDMIENLPDEEFGGPQDVQQMVFGEGSGGNRSRRRQSKDPEHHIIDYLHEKGEARENRLFDYLEDQGIDERDAEQALDHLERRGMCQERNGYWTLTENRGRNDNGGQNRSQGRSSNRQSQGQNQGRSGSYDRQENSPRQGRLRGRVEDGGNRSDDDEPEDPNPEVVSSRSRKDISQREVDAYEERQQGLQDRNESDWDRRLKGHATDAIADARHMRHGYDGRGRVTDEQSDRRLSGNATRAIDDARHMKHGYDGRGRVRKFGPGNFDESIDDDYERYLENKRRQNDEPEADPETGAYSRRRKFDGGNEGSDMGNDRGGSGRRSRR